MMKVNKMNFGSLFTGAGLLDIGFTNAGMVHEWGIELNANIASIANTNGFKTYVGNVTTFDHTTLQAVGWLHASPPCVRASALVGHSTAGETSTDLALSNAVIKYIKYFQPSIFSLENVPNYKKFTSFANIISTLESIGYWTKHRVLSSGDYGVPQVRKRLILLAAKHRIPMFPLQEDIIYWNEVLDSSCLDEIDYIKVLKIQKLIDNGLLNGRCYFDTGSIFNGTRASAFKKEGELITSVSTRNGSYVYDNGKVFQVNIKGLSRLQTIPDSYNVPSVKAIGNGIPCKLAECIARSNIS